MNHDQSAQSDSSSPMDLSLRLSQEYDYLQKQTRNSFVWSTALILISGVVFFGLYTLLAFGFKVPKNDLLIKNLDVSNRKLSDVAEQLKRVNTSSSKTSEAALEFIIAQSKLQNQAIQNIQSNQTQIAPEGLSLLQLLGGSAVLGLIGFLGLQRMQNIDTEIGQLRNYMLEQLKIQMSEGKAMLSAITHQEVERQLETTRNEISNTTDQFQRDMTGALEQFQYQYETAMSGIASAEERTQEILKKYSWVESERDRRAADDIQRITSVTEAQHWAEEFFQANDLHMVRLSLNQIVERKLPGSADHFHNAHLIPDLIGDPELALKILDMGLERFKNNYDLMADKADILCNLGRPNDAISMLEEWRIEQPDEFSRGWRPVVFYAKVMQAVDLTQDRIRHLEAIFEEVTQHLPREVRPWQSYAQFEIKLGNLEKAENIFRAGLKYCPLSQGIKYDLGDLLLKLGHAEEAVKLLEEAWQVDYVEDYQHDVSQYAIRGTLAQAYEALHQSVNGDGFYLDKAAQLYKSIVDGEDAPGTFSQYAKDRLAAISWQKGEFICKADHVEENQQHFNDPRNISSEDISADSHQQG